MTGLVVTLDGRELGRALRVSSRELRPALARFYQRIAVLVERGASERTRGQGAPGSYPIPVRTGDLRRSIASESNDRSATIFSTAVHAGAQHRGYKPYGNARAKPIPPRPFLFDAADKVTVEDELADVLAKVFP